ncbi:MAG: type IA DNA topoisomerase [Thermofilaceae archaeon]|nr:type IA DNA topoisomerase [Thermofilaceae archaeon]MCX8180663.1 type IA DNA topoisomerase [Thermofilaceae archaeon]MDW8003767.1 type IA DNA topoisomerase [Thermofilaceae archaeon]
MWFSKVIVAEKPGVAKAFAAYLAEGRYSLLTVSGVRVYVFKQDGGLLASVGVQGHLIDFDFPPQYNSWHRIDPLELFNLKPIKVFREGMLKYVKVLQQLARSTTTVILALDADVEGEAIAHEVVEVMKKANPKLVFHRAWFTAVTKRDLVNALQQLRTLNTNLANKVFARMILDLTIGAAFTRTLTLMVEKGDGGLPRGRFLSYGPCQTPVLYLVVKRAIERETFQKKKYYQIVSTIKYDNCTFRVKSEKKFEKKEEAAAYADIIRKLHSATIIEADYTERLVEPPEPLATVEMERRASRFLNIRSKRAMDLAEDLYQEGLISYPRTDTTIYPPTLNLRSIAAMFKDHEEIGAHVRDMILSAPKLRVRQGREDDGAHPPIYPLKCASSETIVKRFGIDGWKLYDLIVRHFLATLSPPMKLEMQKIEAEVAGLKLVANGLKIIDPGYTLLYPFEKPHEEILPHVTKGAKAEILDVKAVELETKPPPYISEAELLKLMKRYGIGTDATMQEHIHTNLIRRYFEITKRQCIPTPLGRALIKALEKVAPEAISPEVRGRMEASLKTIAEGLRDPDDVVEEVKREFMGYLKRIKEAEEQVVPILLEATMVVYGQREKNHS